MENPDLTQPLPDFAEPGKPMQDPRLTRPDVPPRHLVGRTIAGLVVTAGVLSIGVGIGEGIVNSHQTGMQHEEANHAPTYLEGADSQKKSEANAATADDWKWGGWAVGLGSISLGIYTGSRLKKLYTDERQHTIRKMRYAAEVYKALGNAKVIKPETPRERKT